MKKTFGLAVAIIFLLAAAIVGWGAWLNYSDENQIANRMNNRAVEVNAVRAARRELTPVIPLDAVRFSSDTITDAVALTEGTIIRWYTGKNKAVHEGDIIAEMMNESIPLKIQQAESAISRAEAALAQAYNSYQRQERLLARRATSKEKYEAAEAQYLAAQGSLREAQVQRDQCLVQQGWLSVKAPLDGEVLIIYQREGAHVQAGTPVALVGDFSWLKFSLNMDDVNARHLQEGQTGFLRFPDRKMMAKAYDTDYGAGNKERGMEIKAVLKEIVPPLSEPADLRRTVWAVDNRTSILEPMTYNGVTMRMGMSYEALAVPLAAMVDKSRDKVFVVDENNIVHERTVKTGVLDDKYIEILSGLAEGEVVITGNLDGLEDGMKADVEMDGED
ncbi:MAG: efflux RND transporter periplasmic adaptor subunit [Selenomonas ruminantium]|jgi:RND family efflux transporter MFP subunit|uniref:Efflux RND transporter periplasmic adaptor subunit n=1 Tax=Selenomonas ruminantium TaxID=971 RepID=A0A927WLN9_SELRU|nr:efflux RND transporter periplasmic adaptor subunit [Selenomonas ruminantium]MBE6084580.1 efflux RND transporter periplasmic adaptor subunit [Selenomonas ruminantium]